MNVKPDIAADLSARLDRVAKMTGRSRADVIRDALENGQSLDWQEEWSRRVEIGIEAADKGDFADEAEMAAIFKRYR